MHPRTKNMLNVMEVPENIQIAEPLGYFDILWPVKNSNIVFTDSGGLQKEAYWLKVPCITLRDETEWIDTVQSGWNVLYKDYNKAHKLIETHISLRNTKDNKNPPLHPLSKGVRGDF